MKTKTELHKPYLIQRLKKPFKIEKNDGKEGVMASLANAFSFGGGLINGGLSKDAMKLINDIWRFDYMGSAEFEFGAVPKSLHQMGEYAIKSNLTAFEFEVTGKISDYSYKFEKDRKRDVENKVTKTVYVICHKDYVDEIKTFISNMADGTKRIYQTKENVGFSSNICGMEYCVDNVGWHDIDNHYLFFTDKEMFDKISVVFGFTN